MIIGADSVIGRALNRRLIGTHLPVVGTSRRKDAAKDSCLYLHIGEKEDAWECPNDIGSAVLCAGVSKIQECASRPNDTWRINVDGIAAVARKLVDRGAFVIFLSTNQVFDGTLPFTPPESPPAPLTEYGRQKAEVEHRLIEMGDSTAIVRLTKVFGPGNSLLRHWADLLRRGQVVEPFYDMAIAPVPLTCVVSVLTLLLLSRTPGIFQISGDRDISYADVALLGVEALNASPSQVRPVSAVDSAHINQPIPANTTLNCERIRSELGIQPPKVEWTIAKAFSDPTVLGFGFEE